MKKLENKESIDKPKETVERIHLTKEGLLEEEGKARFQEHLHRYASIRRFCYGKVLDFASGCGYGSYILSSNPEISSITAIDKDEEAYRWAIQEFSHPKITYKNMDVNDVEGTFDTLVSLETIEHLEDPSVLASIADKCDAKQIILSFPDKKSTHFNIFHLHDLVLQEVADIFKKYVIYHSFRRGDVQFVLLLRLPHNAPAHIFRNIADLKS